jgi:hypothetical protein
MKQTLKLATAVIVLCLLVSCSKDEDPGIEHSWSLTYFTNGFAGGDYQTGDVVWRFDSKKNLTVEINVQLPGLPPVLAEGEYPYELKPEKIVINDVEYGYVLKRNELIIFNHPEVDGPYLSFKSSK